MLLAGFITVSVFLLAWQEPDVLVTPFRRIENATIDLRFRVFRGPRSVTPDVLIVMVDEKKNQGNRPVAMVPLPAGEVGRGNRGRRREGHRDRCHFFRTGSDRPQARSSGHSREHGGRRGAAGRSGPAGSKNQRVGCRCTVRSQPQKAGNVVLALPLVVPDVAACLPVEDAPPFYITSTLFIADTELQDDLSITLPNMAAQEFEEELIACPPGSPSGGICPRKAPAAAVSPATPPAVTSGAMRR